MIKKLRRRHGRIREVGNSPLYLLNITLPFTVCGKGARVLDSKEKSLG